MQDLNLLTMVLIGIQSTETPELLRLMHAMTSDKAQLAKDIRSFCEKYKITLIEEKDDVKPIL